MRHARDNEFSERRKAAAEAKQDLLKKFATAPKFDDPAMAAKRAEREVIIKAREARRAEREEAKRLEHERQLEEATAALAVANAEAEAQAAEKNRLIERVIADEAARKAERDRRYAARKARQN